MIVFTCNSFEGYYPVGSAAVVVAENRKDAVRLLNEKLKSMSLAGNVTENQLTSVNPKKQSVTILVDGNY